MIRRATTCFFSSILSFALLAGCVMRCAAAQSKNRESSPECRVFSRGVPGHGRVALTFDDGPDPKLTAEILDILSENGVRATFFVVGSNAREHPELIDREINEGHEIGTMGDDPSFDGNLSETKADIQKSLESIKTASGVDTVLYYSGSRSVAVSARASRALGLTHVLSTIDLRCGYGSKDDIIKRGLNEPIIGSIILLQPTRACADALGGLIDGLNAKGIIAARVWDVLGGMV